MSKLGTGIVGIQEIKLIKEKFLELARAEESVKGLGVLFFISQVANHLQLRPKRVEHIIYKRLCEPKSVFYDGQIEVLRNNLRSKIVPKRSGCSGNLHVTPDELELVKLKFIEFAKCFDHPPRRGLMHVFELVANDLGTTSKRVSGVIHKHCCKPDSDEYDQEVWELKERIKKATGREVKTVAEEVESPQENAVLPDAEPVPVQLPKNPQLPEEQAERHQWNYSETEQILKAMETRMGKVEKANNELRCENERLQKKKAKNDDLVFQLAERDKQIKNLIQAKAEQTNVIRSQGDRILVLEKQNPSDRPLKIAQAANRGYIKQIAELDALLTTTEAANEALRKENGNLIKGGITGAHEECRLQGENERFQKENDELILKLAKRDRRFSELKDERDKQFNAHGTVALENKRLLTRAQKQSSRIESLRINVKRLAERIEELEKELESSKDGDGAGKKAEVKFIQRWRDRFLPKAEECAPPALDSFEVLPVRAAMAMVQRGDITIATALEKEKGAQNRKSLVQWLESKLEPPEAQGAPF